MFFARVCLNELVYDHYTEKFASESPGVSGTGNSSRAVSFRGISYPRENRCRCRTRNDAIPSHH